MARRRLTLPGEETAAAPAPRPAPAAFAAAPPIARAAAEAAQAGAEAARDARRLAEAEAEGRLLVDIPLERIDPESLTRDRLAGAVPEEDAAELALSLRTHGQRTPAEVVQLGAGRYGLVSGWRRFMALKALFDETGEDRFGALRARVIRTPSAGQGDGEGIASDPAAYIAMVEENEIRLDLSHYERGRIAVMAVEAGAFPDVDRAIGSLFAGASPAKRSKIRSFALVHEALGDALRHPSAIPERLGLRMAEALRALPSARERLRRGLNLADPLGGAQAERAALTAETDVALRLAASAIEPEDGEGPPARRGRPMRRDETVERIGDGLELAIRTGKGAPVVELRGERAAAPEVLEAVRAALRKAAG